MSDSARLLTEIVTLDPGERVGHAVAVARSLPPERRTALLFELSGHDVLARSLAVAAAAATGETALLAGALRDPAPRIRAAVLAQDSVPFDAVAALVDGPDPAPLATRQHAYRWLRRSGAPDVVALLLDPVRERWGDAEAAALLAGCPGDVVDRELPGLAHAVTGWTVLVRRHPEAVTAFAAAELEALAAESRTSWWQERTRLVAALVDRDPAAVLDLCERYLPAELPVAVSTQLHRLLAVDAGRTLDMVLAAPARRDQLTHARTGRRAWRRLDDDRLVALLRAAPDLLVPVLAALPPLRRGMVADRAREGQAPGVPSEPLLRVLPHGHRHIEARRALDRPDVRRPDEVLRLTAALPFPEAEPVLTEATRSADADERARGWALLVESAVGTRDPAVVAEVLHRLNRMRNERDPVRIQVLAAVAAVPVHLLGDAAVTGLDTQLAAVLDAPDTSPGTTRHLGQIVTALVTEPGLGGRAPGLMGWALAALERLGAWRYASLAAPRIARLPHGHEREVLGRLLPGLRAAVLRNDNGPVLAVARMLGRRTRHAGPLQELLGEVVRTGRAAEVREALPHWLTVPGHRRDRARWLLGHDESAITLPLVLDTVLHTDTATIDALVLAGRALRGRFGGRNDVTWVPVLPRAVTALLTPAQVERYAVLLRRALADTGLAVTSAAPYARVLAELPGDGPSRIEFLVGRWALPPSRRPVPGPSAPVPGGAGPAGALPGVPGNGSPWSGADHAGDGRTPAPGLTGVAGSPGHPFGAPGPGDWGAGPWGAEPAAIEPAGAVPGGDAQAGPAALVAEAALTGLARGDDPAAALPLLLARAAGDRPHAVLAAAAASARHVTPERLPRLLPAITRQAAPKVVLRKELVRWQEWLRPDGWLDAVLAVRERTEEHRDVRIAALTSLRAELDDDRVVAAYTEACAADEHTALAVLGPSPWRVPARHRERQAALLQALCSHPDEEVRRRAFDRLGAWADHLPAAGEILTGVVLDGSEDARDIWRTALGTIVRPAVWATRPTLLSDLGAALLGGLRDVDPAADGGRRPVGDRDVEPSGWDEPDAGETRDRPALRRLAALVDLLADDEHAVRRHPGPVLALADVLARREEVRRWAARLRALTLVPGPDLADGLRATVDLLADQPFAAAEITGHLSAVDWDPEHLVAAADALDGRTDTTAGLVLAHLVDWGGEHTGWTAEWRARLRRLRTHPDLQVRLAALDTETAPE